VGDQRLGPLGAADADPVAATDSLLGEEVRELVRAVPEVGERVVGVAVDVERDPVGVALGPPVADGGRHVESLGDLPLEGLAQLSVVVPLPLVEPVGVESGRVHAAVCRGRPQIPTGLRFRCR